jgi:predicted ester cyclase
MADSEASKAIVRRYMEEAWNNGNVDVLDELFTPELVARLTPLVGAFRTGFPDWHCVIDDFVVEGDKVVNRWTGTATHTGNLFGIPPTGKSVAVEGITIHEIVDGRIVSDWSQSDQLSLMQQLGVAPSPGQ